MMLGLLKISCSSFPQQVGMSKLVVINLGPGDLCNGFPTVTAQIFQSVGDRYPMKCMGSLAPVPELEQLYRHWHLLYREYYRGWNLPATRSITIESGSVTHFSEVEFNDLAEQLKNQLNAWLNSESFYSIDRRLSRELNPAEEIRVIIETNDYFLKRLPWHLWNFFEDYPKAEVALSVQEYGHVNRQSQTPAGIVRILAILGKSDGIDIQADRKLLENLPGAEPLFLEEPTLQELHDRLWDAKGWDILFFAGHSQTDVDTGRIYINQTEGLTLSELRHALKNAISRGLQLAIFNSCDGLGVAQSLADLNIPHVIVMRELVPDVVAQEFFRQFLTVFSSEQSLYTSVQEAREKLEKLERDYPYATWLPVICQNPTEPLTTWQSLRGALPRDRRFNRKQGVKTLFLASALLAASIGQIRQLGLIERWELQAFDQMMRLRPAEPLDSRILIVTVTEKDVQSQDPQERRGSSISDPTLAQLLAKLQPYQPRVIGLDIYRDFPIDPDQANLKNQIQQNQQLIAVCEVGEGNEHPGTRPLPSIPAERQSFSDMPVDPDGVIRRQILGMTQNPNSYCAIDTSFSFRVAQLYLAGEGMYAQRSEAGTLQIESTVLPRLNPQSGGYHQLDARGYQIFLNYRAPGKVAQEITLSELLDGSLDSNLPQLVQDRIVLIGTTAKSFNDYSSTLYKTGSKNQEMPGVLIQAHMVSQLISAVLDQRPLLWGFPLEGTTLWVWGWSMVGGGLVLCMRSPLELGVASGVALSSLYGLCFILLLQGGWAPILPAALALISAEVSMIAYIAYQKRPLL